jgi:hypothetical protein
MILGLVSELMENSGLNISVNKTVAAMITFKRRCRLPQFILQGETLDLKGHIR